MATNIMILAVSKYSEIIDENSYPLCLTEMMGVSILEKIVLNTKRIEKSSYMFVFSKRDIDYFYMDNVSRILVPDREITIITGDTMGSACSALLAGCRLPEDDSLLIISANELVDIDFSRIIMDFEGRDLDGGTLVFRSVHPRYSYVRLNNDGLVEEATQKKPISPYATAGVFWFRKTGDFVEAAKSSIRKNAVVGGRFYVAPTFNDLILKQKRIGVLELDGANYYPLKTERQIEKFETGN